MGKNQNFVGLVVSQGKMSKTVKVRVQSKVYDKKVHKEILKRKDYLVHDEGNLCKEGDIVRIQQIPKISARKFFAIAEIKVNMGQQFAQYEELAREKIKQEEDQKLQDFIKEKHAFDSIVTQIEDLRKLDTIASNIQSSNDEMKKQDMINQINEIKLKYGIESWPSTKPILPLQINQQEGELQELSEIDNRRLNISKILTELMENDQYSSQKSQIFNQLSKDPSTLPKHTQKNILRKYILDPKNECPVEY